MKVIDLNCGVEFVDCDIETLSDSEYNLIKEIFCNKLLIVFKNQKRKTIPYMKLVTRLGEVANWSQCSWDINGNPIISFGKKAIDPFTYSGLDEKYPVQRVTGQKTKGIRSGIFGEGKLDWHSNMNGPFNRANGVALQAVSEGTIGTSTSWMDTTKAYEAMSDELKARCQGVIGKFEYSPEIWAEGLPKGQYESMLVNKEPFYEMPLLNKSYSGKIGLYFHYLNSCSFPSDPELLEVLKDHCFQDRFIYKHVWNPGDIVISDQVLTLHKRDQDDPSILNERVLIRNTFNYETSYN